MSRARPIHPEDALVGREWDRECFICDERSYMGPSFICVEAQPFMPLFSCARCRRADAQPDAKRIKRHDFGHLLTTMTWRECSPVVLPWKDDPLVRLLRAGLDAHFRAEYESYSITKREENDAIVGRGDGACRP